MKAEKLVAIYVIVLAMAAFVSALFPSFTSDLVNLFTPIKADLTHIWHIRYRMTLFISASLILPILVPYIAVVGFHGTNIRGVMRLSWIKTLLIVFLSLFLWIAFPSVGLCRKCWASNDYFYFFLAFGIFIGLQINAQFFLLKIGVTLRQAIRCLMPKKKIFRDEKRLNPKSISLF